MRNRLLVVPVVALAIVISACSSTSEGTRSPAPQPESPVPSASAAASADAEPTDGPAADGDQLTDETLIDLCVEKTRSYYSADVEFLPAEARIEARKVDPPWLVIVPSRTLGAESASVCTIGGTVSAPIFEANAAQTPPTDQEIQDAIDGVEHYTG